MRLFVISCFLVSFLLLGSVACAELPSDYITVFHITYDHEEKEILAKEYRQDGYNLIIHDWYQVHSTNFIHHKGTLVISPPYIIKQQSIIKSRWQE